MNPHCKTTLKIAAEAVISWPLVPYIKLLHFPRCNSIASFVESYRPDKQQFSKMYSQFGTHTFCYECVCIYDDINELALNNEKCNPWFCKCVHYKCSLWWYGSDVYCCQVCGMAACLQRYIAPGSGDIKTKGQDLCETKQPKNKLHIWTLDFFFFLSIRKCSSPLSIPTLGAK